MSTPEVELKAIVFEFLWSLPNSIFWQNDSLGITKGRKRENRYRPSGIPDILGCVSGQFVGIELKVGNNKLLKSQLKFSSELMQCGGYYYTVRSIVDIQEIAKINGWFDGP